MTSRLALRVEHYEGTASLVPEIDGIALTVLVGSFETAQGYNSASGYGGIVPAFFNFGDLSRHYLGNQSRQWPGPGEAWLLGCDCGEVGCWPLCARITLTNDTVTWSHFRQPYRRDWDYSGFGPFQFDRRQYETAIAEGIRQLQA